MAVATRDAAPVGRAVGADRERPPAEQPLASALWRRFGRLVITLLNVGGFIALWQWAVASGMISALFLPLPTEIYNATIRMANSGQLWTHVSFSGQNFVVGFALAALIGIPFGLGMGASRWLDTLFAPYVWALYATPRIALQPLFILWLGFTIQSYVAIIFLSGLMPILISSMDGVKTVDQSLLRAARVFGASKRQLYIRVVLPFTLPFIMTGLRQGVGRALIGLLVAEFLGSSKGVGYVISRAGQRMEPAEMFSMLTLLVLFSVSMVYFMGVLEKRVAQWREEVRV
jgi:ABC-type nitrate/sulfonate/bicarbonate transport system permease component